VWENNGSHLVYDDCSVCGGNNSSCSDDCGIPYGDNSTCSDDCGVPNGNNSSCIDCAGIPNGNSQEDMCGICDDDSFNDCVQDCTGEWGGSAAFEMFYDDLDGDGFGAGEGYEMCNGLDLGGWVANNDDLDDDCPNPDPYASMIDDCNVCIEAGYVAESCYDCANVPFGSAYVDECDVCDDDVSNDCVQDCTGSWGGSVIIDECGVCGGNGILEGDCDCYGNVDLGCGCGQGANCDGTPEDFIFNQSTLQAFYYVHDIRDMYDIEIEDEDWVGAFSGNTCIGTRKWDSSLCMQGQCDLPVMGDDGYSYAEGYLNEGEFPTFKFYDDSEQEYYDLHPDQNHHLQIIIYFSLMT
jgi:hypothetical protein